ncbi:MAG: glycosyltransferase [candidate division FCPU426 bacterium]
MPLPHSSSRDAGAASTSRPLRVAMLTSWDEPCGIADFSRALAEALAPAVDVKVVPLKHGVFRPGYYRGLAAACSDCDVAHVQHEYVYFGGRDPWNNYWPLLARSLRVPYVVTAHTRLRPFSGGPWWKRLLRGTREAAYQAAGWSRFVQGGQFRTARRVLVHTRGHAQALLDLGLDATQVRLVPQGAPSRSLAGNAEAARKRWSISGPIVTIFGFLIPSKGHLLALEAWRRLNPRATLMIAGRPFSEADQPYAQSVARAAQTAGGSVRLTGYLEPQDLADLLAASDLVLLPYLGGTSSYALSVVLAQGRPVLASDLEYFRETAAEHASVAMFKAGDADDLAVNLQRLLAGDQQRQELSRAAQAWATAHAWDRIASQVRAIYAEVLESRSEAGRSSHAR